MTISKSIEWKKSDTAILIVAALWITMMIALQSFDSLFFRADMTSISARQYAVREAISSGQLPLWNRFYSEPILANPEAITLYPPAFLLRFFPLPIFVVLYSWLHLILLFASNYILVRHWNFSRLSSVAAAGVVAFSSFVFVRLVVGHLGILPMFSWSILTFLFYARLIHHERFRDLIGTVFAASMIILSGHTQYSITALLISGSYALFFLAQQLSWASLFRVIKYSGLVGIILAGILGVQLLPSAEYFATSSRIDGLKWREIMDGKLTPITSLNFLMSYSIYGAEPKVNIQETLYFTSLMIPGFVLISWFYSAKKYRPMLSYLTILGVISIIFALGDLTPVYRIVVYGIFPMFRAPGRFLHLLILPYLLFTAIAIETLQNKQTYDRSVVFIILSVIVPIMILAGIYFPQLTGTDFKGNPLGLILLSISILLWIFVILSRFGLSKQTWLRLVVLVLLVESSLHAVNLGVWFPRFPSFSQMVLDERQLSCIAQDIDDTSVRLQQSDLGQVGYWHIRLAGAFGIPVVNSHPSNISWANEIWNTTPSLLQANYQITDKDPQEDWQKLDSECAIDLYHKQDSDQSRVYAVNQVIWADADQTLSAIGDTNFDPTQSVVISNEESTIQDILNSDDELEYNTEIIEYTANEVSIKANVSTSAILVLADIYYPGWTAYVDGVSTPVMKVNHGLRGILLKPGNHAILIQYNPPSFYIGLAISITTALLLLLAYFSSSVRRVLGLQS